MLKKTFLSLALLLSTLVIAASWWQKETTVRTSEFPVQPIILNRHSPRAMSGEMISRPEFMTLLEAARFAPSSYNSQPWRFIYGFKGTPAWDRLFKLLVPFNQLWVENGSVLVLVVSEKLFAHNQQPSRTHSFDTGAACENFALQGNAQGFVVHGMSGFDYDAARAEFAIPEPYAVEAMFCVGKPGAANKLPEALQGMEVVSPRKALHEVAFEGQFVVSANN